MRSARLNRRVQLERIDPQLSPESAPAWTAVDTLWAEVMPVSGREYLGADQLIGETLTRFRIRYRADVTPGMRFRFQRRFYDIRAVIPPKWAGDELHCQAVDSGPALAGFDAGFSFGFGS
jgi:SPP1 family predicted phage head-tail adaptor